MSHFWPFCFLTRPNLKHIHLCCICYPDKWCFFPQCFQREVSNHQPLTSSVLHTGQLLLNCINNTSPCPCVRQKKPFIISPFSRPTTMIPSLTFSPVLRDALLLIEKQSGAIGAHQASSPSMWHDPQTAGARPWARRVKGYLDRCVSSYAWTMPQAASWRFSVCVCFHRRNQVFLKWILALKSWVSGLRLNGREFLQNTALGLHWHLDPVHEHFLFFPGIWWRLLPECDMKLIQITEEQLLIHQHLHDDWRHFWPLWGLKKTK